MFARFGGKKKDEEKDKQIRDLCNTFPSIRRPQNDDTLFEMLFDVSRVYSTLRIYIPADFPNGRPVLQVIGPLNHSWLDKYKWVVGCEKLNSWTKASSLSEIVQLTLSALRGGTNNHAAEDASITSSASSSAMETTAGTGSSQQGVAASTPTAYPTLPSQNGYSSPSYTNGVASPVPTQQVHRPSWPLPNPEYGAGAAGGRAGAESNYRPSSTPRAVTPPPLPPYQLQHLHQHQQLQYGQSVPKPHQPMSPADLYAHDHAYSDPAKSRQSSRTPTPPQQRQRASKTTIPDIPASFPELQALSEAQLERLKSDNIALHTHMRSIATVGSMRSLRDELRQSNLDLATEVLTQEDQLSNLHAEVIELQRKIKNESNEYHRKLLNYEEKYSVSQESAVRELQSKRDTLEETTDIIAREFVDGHREMSSFLNDFLEARTRFHAIDAKLQIIVKK